MTTTTQTTAPAPSSLSDAEIGDVVAELAPRLAGAPVGKVWDGDGPTLLVELGRHRLVLSAHPRASRVHLETTRAPAAATPSGFAMLCRKRLSGLRLAGLAVAPGERVVVLDFGPGRDRLVAELTGPHANLLLVGPDSVIVALLRPGRGATRPLAPGAPYAPPPPAPPDARWRGRRRFGAPPGVAARVAAHYEAVLAAAEAADLRARLAGVLHRAIDRLARREQALGADRARAERAASFRKLGDLLLAHLHELPGRGRASASVPDDFEDGAPLSIALDPALDARQNADRYYRQHRRLTAGLARIDERLARTRAAREAREADLARLLPLDLPALRALSARVAAAAPRGVAARARGREQPSPRLPYREYRSAAGHAIWVGRGAADNDALTFRHARGNDLWLHTRDAPGPHVVVPLRGGLALAEPTLLDAATLAAHFSPLGGEAQVDVSYTYVKNLRKPKGTAAGRVFLSEAKTLRVRIDRDRLERLLGREADDGGGGGSS